MNKIAHYRMLYVGAIVLLAVCLVRPVLSLTEEDGGYELVWTTVTASGTSSGGDFVLAAVVGEPFGGKSAGGDYEMRPAIEPAISGCKVNFDRFAIFAQNWLQSGEGTWVNLDEEDDVNFLDYQLLTERWLEYCPTGWQ